MTAAAQLIIPASRTAPANRLYLKCRHSCNRRTGTLIDAMSQFRLRRHIGISRVTTPERQRLQRQLSFHSERFSRAHLRFCCSSILQFGLCKPSCRPSTGEGCIRAFLQITHVLMHAPILFKPCQRVNPNVTQSDIKPVKTLLSGDSGNFYIAKSPEKTVFYPIFL